MCLVKLTYISLNFKPFFCVLESWLINVWLLYFFSRWISNCFNPVDCNISFIWTQFWNLWRQLFLNLLENISGACGSQNTMYHWILMQVFASKIGWCGWKNTLKNCVSVMTIYLFPLEGGKCFEWGWNAKHSDNSYKYKSNLLSI